MGLTMNARAVTAFAAGAGTMVVIDRVADLVGMPAEPPGLAWLSLFVVMVVFWWAVQR